MLYFHLFDYCLALRCSVNEAHAGILVLLSHTLLELEAIFDLSSLFVKEIGSCIIDSRIWSFLVARPPSDLRFEPLHPCLRVKQIIRKGGALLETSLKSLFLIDTRSFRIVSQMTIEPWLCFSCG